MATQKANDPARAYRQSIYGTYSSVSGLNRPLDSKYRAHRFNLGRLLKGTPAGERVLDVGSGQGEALMAYGDLGFDAEGIDISAELVDSCTSRGLKVTLIANLLDHLESLSNEYGVVSLIDVLEHFSKTEAVELLGTIKRRVLRRGGKLIIQVPNMQSPWAAYNMYCDFTHEVGYTERSIVQLLNAMGFSSVSVGPQDYPPQGLHRVRNLLRQTFYVGLRAVLLVDQPNRGRILTPNLIAAATA
jgi:2-polyprenyl-3-methyl-5-hydroxy-6-metoxy-1,4-benzoquinol methylase